MSLTVPSAAHSMFCGFRSRWRQLDACSTCAAVSSRVPLPSARRAVGTLVALPSARAAVSTLVPFPSARAAVSTLVPLPSARRAVGTLVALPSARAAVGTLVPLPSARAAVSTLVPSARWRQLDACSTCAADCRCRCGRGVSPLSPGADVVRLGADVCGLRPVPAPMCTGVRPHSPGTDVRGVEPA
jgi:hypothetical protein